MIHYKTALLRLTLRPTALPSALPLIDGTDSNIDHNLSGVSII